MNNKETRVLNLLKKGKTNVQIASKLAISLRIVEYRRKKLMVEYRANTAFQLGYKTRE